MNLEHKDLEIIRDYIYKYGASFAGETVDVHTIAPLYNSWRKNKKELYKMFGEEVILSRPVCFDFNPEDLMTTALVRDKGMASLYERLKAILPEEYSMDLKKLFCNPTSLGTNSMIEDVRLPLTQGKMLRVNKGDRPLRAIQKLANAYNLDGDFRIFQRSHSLALNQTHIEGDLCLSIHPMDFLTASDNAENWDTCMRLRPGGKTRRYGDYRAGVMEALADTRIVCAYVKSNKNTCEGWNSKRWRMFFIVGKDYVVGIRAYPYANKQLAEMCGRWLMELNSSYYGTEYREPLWVKLNEVSTYYTFISGPSVYFRQDKEDMIGYPDEFHPNEEYFFAFGTNYEGKTTYFDLHYPDTPPTCPICGEQLLNPWEICCCECAPYPTCDKCGQAILTPSDMCYTDVNSDDFLCRECYDNVIEIDSITGDIITDWVELHCMVNGSLTPKTAIIDTDNFNDEDYMSKYVAGKIYILDDEIAHPEYYCEEESLTQAGRDLFYLDGDHPSA